MKSGGLPKLKTVSAPMALLGAYEPLTKRFLRKIGARVPKPGRKYASMSLFFRRNTKAGAEVKIFNRRSVTVKNSFYQLFGFSLSDTRNSSLFKTELRPALPGKREAKNESSPSFSSYEAGRTLLFADRRTLLAKRLSSPPPLSHRGEASTAEAKERFSHLPTIRFERSKKPQKVLLERERIFEKEVAGKRAVEPLALRYRENRAKERTASVAHGAAASKSDAAALPKEYIRSESREIRIHERVQIEKISEKVYTLVMRKWEQERRRRGVLYE